MIQPGKYSAKIVNYYAEAPEQEGKHPYVRITFEVEGQGTVPFTGYFSAAAADKTLEHLIYCGFTDSDPGVLSQGVESGALDMLTPVLITVEHKPDKDDPTKVHPQVRWINPLKIVTPQQKAKAKSALSQFAGQMALKKQELGVKPKTPTAGF